MTSIVAPTWADLDAAPERSRLVRDYGGASKTVFHKRADGRWQFGARGRLRGLHVPAGVLSVHYGQPNATLHHPAPVRVTPWGIPGSVTSGWTFTCRICSSGFPGFYWHSDAMDAARDHARAHAEVTA